MSFDKTEQICTQDLSSSICPSTLALRIVLLAHAMPNTKIDDQLGSEMEIHNHNHHKLCISSIPEETFTRVGQCQCY